MLLRNSSVTCVACAVSVALATSTALCGPIVIDDFSSPAVPELKIIGLLDPNPTFFSQSGPGIVGGLREVLIEVLGTPMPLSVAVSSGGGMFAVASTTPGSEVSLGYRGTFFNPLLLDITDGGTNDRFELNFLTLGAGPSSNDLDVEILLKSAVGQAVFNGAIPESAGPFSYTALFNSFTTSGAFDPTAVTSIEFSFNAPGNTNVDYVLSSIVVEVPEPAALGTAALALVSLLVIARRARRRP